jgi:hypothetical protein
MLSVTGAQVSAVRRVPGGALEIRVFNPSGATTEVNVASSAAGLDEAFVPPTASHGCLVDLRGGYIASFERSFELGPYQIATLRLSDGP